MGLLIFSAIAITFLAIALNRNIKKLRRDFCSKAETRVRFSSLPSHYSYFFVLWSLIFTFVVNLTSFPQPAKFVILGTLIVTIFALTKFFFRKNFNAKKQIEKLGTVTLSITAGIGIIITIAVTLSILFESIRFFGFVKLQNFLFGLEWNPQMASAEPESLQKAFGIIPVFTGTLLITLVAMIVAIPLGIVGATYLCFYAKAKTRDYLKPILEILAGIPTVVYGYFAVIAVAPFFKHFFNSMGIEIASESALAAGFVMGVMIIPFVLSLSDDAINSVPQALKDGALAMGSTKSEMIKKVALPAAMPSIVGAVILAVSRAIGETMIVVMAAGLIAKLTLNPLAASTTATVQIVTLLVGDQEFNSPKTLAAFALALTLFIFTFALNIVALAVIKNYKKRAV